MSKDKDIRDLSEALNCKHLDVGCCDIHIPQSTPQHIEYLYFKCTSPNFEEICTAREPEQSKDKGSKPRKYRGISTIAICRMCDHWESK